MKSTSFRKQSSSEEIANSITHGIGAGLSIAALVLLIVYSSIYGGIWHVVSFSIYGATLVILYISSTLYHSFRNPRLKHIFHILDHSCIFLLIAGTYTPFTLVTLRGNGGWWIFGVIWGLAISGIVLKAFFINKFRKLSVVIYIAMGWIIMFAMRPLIHNLPGMGLMWLLIGGLCYTGGIFFYAYKKIPFGHSLWHLFVLGGSISHFFSIFFYVLPRA